MLISPTEPEKIKALGETSGLPERFGCDVLITAGSKLTGVQRKQFPEDFLASRADGRVAAQLAKMGPLDRRLLILEGFGSWTTDGVLISQRQFTRKQMFGVCYSYAYEYGVEVLRVRDMAETAEALQELEAWAGKDKHTSLVQRPGPPADAWNQRKAEAWAVHLLQGFPGIGPGLARKIYEHFGRVPLRWIVETAKDLQAVPGIGKGKAEALWRLLEKDTSDTTATGGSPRRTGRRSKTT